MAKLMSSLVRHTTRWANKARRGELKTDHAEVTGSNLMQESAWLRLKMRSPQHQWTSINRLDLTLMTAEVRRKYVYGRGSRDVDRIHLNPSPSKAPSVSLQSSQRLRSSSSRATYEKHAPAHETLSPKTQPGASEGDAHIHMQSSLLTSIHVRNLT